MILAGLLALAPAVSFAEDTLADSFNQAFPPFDYYQAPGPAAGFGLGEVVMSSALGNVAVQNHLRNSATANWAESDLADRIFVKSNEEYFSLLQKREGAAEEVAALERRIAFLSKENAQFAQAGFTPSSNPTMDKVSLELAKAKSDLSKAQVALQDARIAAVPAEAALAKQLKYVKSNLPALAKNTKISSLEKELAETALNSRKGLGLLKATTALSGLVLLDGVARIGISVMWRDARLTPYIGAGAMVGDLFTPKKDPDVLKRLPADAEQEASTSGQ